MLYTPLPSHKETRAFWFDFVEGTRRKETRAFWFDFVESARRAVTLLRRVTA